MKYIDKQINNNDLIKDNNKEINNLSTKKKYIKYKTSSSENKYKFPVYKSQNLNINNINLDINKSSNINNNKFNKSNKTNNSKNIKSERIMSTENKYNKNKNINYKGKLENIQVRMNNLLNLFSYLLSNKVKLEYKRK